jgi:Family of unknown function (DUF6527)
MWKVEGTANQYMDFDGTIWHDIGEGHYWSTIVCGSIKFRDQWCGINESHWHKAKLAQGIKERCVGYVAFTGFDRTEGPLWTKTGDENSLTLAPSVHCDEAKGGCGSHGWIQNGRWKEA